MKIRFMCIIVVLVLILGLIFWPNGHENITVETVPDESEGIVVEQGSYYKIIQSESLYYCYFYDQHSKNVKTEGPMNRIPHVETIDKSLVKFTLQSGTGMGTQWGYFYNPETVLFSEVYQCIWDQAGDMVAYADVNRIVVRDIFDKKEYYKEFNDFSYPFSEVAEHFVSVQFAENDTCIDITYFSGDDYKEVTERFML